jgi:hypothetical protein
MHVQRLEAIRRLAIGRLASLMPPVRGSSQLPQQQQQTNSTRRASRSRAISPRPSRKAVYACATSSRSMRLFNYMVADRLAGVGRELTSLAHPSVGQMQSSESQTRLPNCDVSCKFSAKATASNHRNGFKANWFKFLKAFPLEYNLS